MTIDEGNALIAKFIGLKLRSDNKTWELNEKLSQILKCKTTQFVKFNENYDLLFAAVEHIAAIKDLWIMNSQYEKNKCYVGLFYKAQCIEGEWKLARFSCEREKPISKHKQALFEVLSTFCGWYYNHPECQTEIEYDFAYTTGEVPNNIIYMEPKQVICPKCGKIYREKDVKEENKNEE